MPQNRNNYRDAEAATVSRHRAREGRRRRHLARLEPAIEESPLGEALEAGDFVPAGLAKVVAPPTDDEKYHYLKGPQHRWFFWAHAASFVGIGASLYGFAQMTYWTLIFMVPLTLYAAETLLGLRTSTYKRSISLPDHQFVVETWTPQVYPSVDVYIPTAGEPLEVLENTYRYVDLIEYPGEVTVYVLDDMNRPELRSLVETFYPNFIYYARPGSAFKKAGNLQWAFERSTGDHIWILDADFVPRADCLTETVPYMEEARIGIIQTPQYYPSRGDNLTWIERHAASTQEMFYRFVQPSRDTVEATICCGTSALYRREALNAIGGFPLISHSEDVFTGFEMMKHDYRTAYVPIVVSQGLCPDAIDPYISQQYRWCEGSMELLKGTDFHLHPNITLRQRLSFWSGFFYYITTAMNGFFAPIPVLVMIWLFPQYVRASNMIPLIGLLILWLVVYPILMRGKWRLATVRVQIIYGFTHAVAIYDMFFGTQAAWVPSNGVNRATPLATKVKSIMGLYLLAGMVGIVAGVAYQATRPGFELVNWWSLLAFSAVNAYVFVPVVWVCLSTLFVDGRIARRETVAAKAAAMSVPDNALRPHGVDVKSALALEGEKS